MTLDGEKSHTPNIRITILIAGAYVLSGVIQPILMAIAENAGIADPKCQIYMLAYYLGPFLVSFSLCCKTDQSKTRSDSSAPAPAPSLKTIRKAIMIALFDLTAQSMNYSGAAMAGPTLFAIIYSSVTVWTAVLSLIILRRYMTCMQWSGVITVFLGLVITAFDSVTLGSDVFFGSCLVFFGSAMHALTYVLSESIMTIKPSEFEEPLTAVMNCTIQAGVAVLVNLLWQLTYTRTHYHELILIPMQEKNTSPLMAIYILGAIGFTSLIHATSYFYTLKNFPGGATSAGVGKGLQAVLVFVATSTLICGRFGGKEMCFSFSKAISLVTVGSGVIIFARATKHVHYSKIERALSRHKLVRLSTMKKKSSDPVNYEAVSNVDDV